MNRETAKKISFLLKEQVQTSESFNLVEKIDSGLVEGFHVFANEKDSFGRFLLSNDEQTLWLLVIDWKSSGNYYLVLYPENSNYAPLAELHRETPNDEGEDLEWSYVPRKKDGKNEDRKNAFRSMYGTCEAVISLPNNVVTLDDFLNDIFHLARCRLLADELNETYTSIVPESFAEGKRLEKKHYARERSSLLVNEAKRQHALKNDGFLPCEVCGFDFKKIYGEKGAQYIEAHHKIPLSELDDNEIRISSVHDLGMVCANCHRMLHRSPRQTIEELKLSLNAL